MRQVGNGGDFVAGEIARLQSGQFCRPANLPAIRALAQRSLAAVGGG